MSAERPLTFANGLSLRYVSFLFQGGFKKLPRPAGPNDYSNVIVEKKGQVTCRPDMYVSGIQAEISLPQKKLTLGAPK